jgi:hypothetical protein
MGLAAKNATGDQLTAGGIRFAPSTKNTGSTNHSLKLREISPNRLIGTPD